MPEANSSERLPASAHFTTTHWSVVLAAKGGASASVDEALEKLCRAYWPPLYAYIRREGHDATEAQDLTQEFFARMLEKDFLDHLHHQQGKFRSFLLTFLKHFLAEQRRKAVVLFDPGWALEAPPELNQLGLQKPFLSMNSQRTDSRPAQPASPPYTTNWLYGSRLLFTNAISDAYWFQIQDSTHQSFQDRGSLISEQARTNNPTPISRAQAQTIRACTLWFFNKYLKGEDDHLLDNPAAVHTNIFNFQRK